MPTLNKTFIALIAACAIFNACKKKETSTPEPITNITINTSLPAISAGSISGITEVSAKFSGTVTSEGSSAITAVGICWDTLPEPTTLGDRKVIGAGIGRFTSSLQGLKANKTYYARAFATNATGTAYSKELEFKTRDIWRVLAAPNTIGSFAFLNGTMFVGTPTGVYRSSDEGEHWLISSTGITFSVITCLTSYNTFIYAGTNSGQIYMSSNGGSSWTSIGTDPAGYSIREIVVDGPTIYTRNNNNTIRESTNGGSWNNVNTQTSSPACIAVKDGKLYAGTQNGVLVTSDKGVTWTTLSNNSTSINRIAISGDNILAASSTGLSLSTDNGATWKLVSGVSMTTVLYTKGNDVYVGHPASLLVSHDNGVTFPDIMPTIQTSVFALGASDKNLFLGGFSLFRLSL